MLPFDWDDFTLALEELGCKVSYGHSKPGFYYNGEYLYSLKDVFPEIFHQTEKFDIFMDDALRGRDIVKYSYSGEYQQTSKMLKSEYMLENGQCNVIINNYHLKEAA